MAKRVKKVKSKKMKSGKKSGLQKFFYSELLRLSKTKAPKIKTKKSKGVFTFTWDRKKRTRSEIKDIIASLPIDNMQSAFPNPEFANITMKGTYKGKTFARTYSVSSSSDEFYDGLLDFLDNFVDDFYDGDLNYYSK